MFDYNQSHNYSKEELELIVERARDDSDSERPRFHGFFCLQSIKPFIEQPSDKQKFLKSLSDCFKQFTDKQEQ